MGKAQHTYLHTFNFLSLALAMTNRHSPSPAKSELAMRWEVVSSVATWSDHASSHFGEGFGLFGPWGGVLWRALRRIFGVTLCVELPNVRHREAGGGSNRYVRPEQLNPNP